MIVDSGVILKQKKREREKAEEEEEGERGANIMKSSHKESVRQVRQ